MKTKHAEKLEDAVANLRSAETVFKKTRSISALKEVQRTRKIVMDILDKGIPIELIKFI